jgi:hypothetical protein
MDERTVFVEFGAPIAIGLVATLLAWVILRYWPRGRERPVRFVHIVRDLNDREIGRYEVSCRNVAEALGAEFQIRLGAETAARLKPADVLAEVEADQSGKIGKPSLREQVRRNREAARQGER